MFTKVVLAGLVFSVWCFFVRRFVERFCKVWYEITAEYREVNLLSGKNEQITRPVVAAFIVLAAGQTFLYSCSWPLRLWRTIKVEKYFDHISDLSGDLVISQTMAYEDIAILNRYIETGDLGLLADIQSSYNRSRSISVALNNSIRPPSPGIQEFSESLMKET